MKKLFLILASIIILSGCQKTILSTQVVENYFKYINEENENKLNNLFMDSLDSEDVKSLFDNIKELKISNMDIENETNEKSEVFVEFEVIYEDGKSSAFNDGQNFRLFTLEKVNKKWKIKSIGLL